jgi:hypothetical protein
VENFLFGSRCQGGEIREAAHPSIIIRNDSGDLGLLQHELGNEDRVRIAGAAPGKIAAVLAIPRDEGAAERGGVREWIHGDEENV